MKQWSLFPSLVLIQCWILGLGWCAEASPLGRVNRVWYNVQFLTEIKLFSETAAIFNGSGPVPLAYLEGDQAYKSFMLATTNGSHTYDEAAAKTMFKEALTQIREKALSGTADPFHLGSVNVPFHIKTEWPEFQTIFEAAAEFDPAFNHVIRIRKTHWAMLTYPPNFCLEDWGLSGVPDDYDPYVLYFEQDFGRLQVVLVQVGIWGPLIERSEALPWPLRPDDLRAATLRVIGKVTLDEIPAVVVSIENTNTDISVVDTVLHEHFPDLAPKIQEPVGGRHFVGAVGASCVARQIAIRPEIIGDDILVVERHDEL